MVQNWHRRYTEKPQNLLDVRGYIFPQIHIACQKRRKLVVIGSGAAEGFYRFISGGNER